MNNGKNLDMDSESNNPKSGEVVAADSSPSKLNSLKSDDIFRSMKINDTSKTPYSDATQVRLRLN